MRESETLSGIDEQDRLGFLDTGQLISGNRNIIEQSLKFPHLDLSGSSLKALPSPEVGFLFRQTLLNYLRSESRQLSESKIFGESILIRRSVGLIDEQLKWASNDVMYRVASIACAAMNPRLSAALQTLRDHQPELRALGVRHASVFGSVARCESRPDSDVDVLVELDPERPIGIFEYSRIKLNIAELIGGPVDVVNRSTVKPLLRENILNGAFDVF